MTTSRDHRLFGAVPLGALIALGALGFLRFNFSGGGAQTHVRGPRCVDCFLRCNLRHSMPESRRNRVIRSIRHLSIRSGVSAMAILVWYSSFLLLHSQAIETTRCTTNITRR